MSPEIIVCAVTVAIVAALWIAYAVAGRVLP
jgi:hypothetical protein